MLDEINSFNNSLQKHGIVMVNPKVEFDKENKSTKLICDIKGAMYSTNSYDFHWLLADLPFDLYAFEQSEKELTYQGKINGVPTTIKLIFPYKILIAMNTSGYPPKIPKVMKTEIQSREYSGAPGGI